MTIVAVGVGVAAVGVGVAAYSASAQGDANSKASAAQREAYAQQQAALNAGRNQARSDLQPYATSGKNALNELNWQLGLPTGQGPATQQNVPNTYITGQSGDPVWEKILADYNAQSQAQYGTPMNRPWESDADAQRQYGILSQQYLAQKNANPDSSYQGVGQKGGLLQPYGMDQYKNDPGYTPMVNDLASLQATPGYQFQLEQGLQSVNGSSAAKGSLLSSGQLKGINNYAQDYASTSYDAAYNRAQQAYQAAFNRNQSNKTNTFNMLGSLVGGGQSAAGTQANASINTAAALAGAAGVNGSNQAQYAINQGNINSNLASGIGGAITSGAGIATGSGGGYGSYFSGAGNGSGIVQGSGNGQINAYGGNIGNQTSSYLGNGYRNLN